MMRVRWLMGLGAVAMLAAPAARAQGLGIPPLTGTRLRLFLSAGQAPGNAPGDSGAGVPNPGVAHIHDLHLYLPGPLPGGFFGPGRGAAGAGGAGAMGTTGAGGAARPAITPVKAPTPAPAAAPAPAPSPAPMPQPMPGDTGAPGGAGPGTGGR